MKKAIIAALALCASAPAHADAFKDREIAFQVLNLADAAQTCYIVGTGRGVELNPLLGKRPDCGRVMVHKLTMGAFHFMIAKSLNEREARTFQIVTLVIQGGVVGANMRFVF
jgi:hypothetical protein